MNTSWYPHSSHCLIADACAELYVRARSDEKFDDVSSVLVYVAEALEAQGGMTQEGIFDGSFVNNWDIGNLVADYLVFRTTGGEGCSCNTRHRFLSLLLDGETPLEQTHGILHFCLSRCGDPQNKKKRDLVISPDAPIASLSPLASSPGSPGSPPSLVAGDVSDLLFLKKTVLPDPDDDLDGHDSLNDIIKTLHGEESTVSEWKKIPDDPDSTSIATTFEALQIVAKALAWADFISDGAAGAEHLYNI
ncbi:hypothetical protein TrRE_jg4752 [Triparma retinervis]|uniref:Uncharacterized protein n=1 Tax=Triparma retinervis TaxID=2557542 RepID=A0A9W7AA91_9STRA|nr:hypothetical protein TrRE_jg4752 [Triparma retinervis]